MHLTIVKDDDASADVSPDLSATTLIGTRRRDRALLFYSILRASCRC
jgi:hypothetical protein